MSRNTRRSAVVTDGSDEGAAVSADGAAEGGGAAAAASSISSKADDDNDVGVIVATLSYCDDGTIGIRSLALIKNVGPPCAGASIVASIAFSSRTDDR